MFKDWSHKDKFTLKGPLVFLMVIIILFGTFFLLLIYKKDNFVIAGENFGGWIYDNFFGWTSESCNNLYGSTYEDYCGINVDSSLEFNFDGNDINSEIVQDNSGYNNDGTLFNFDISNIRNGGKNRTSGLATRDSNFDNSLYFNGINNYIEIEGFDPEKEFTITWWAKAPEKTANEGLFHLGSQGINIVGEGGVDLRWNILGSNTITIENVFLWDNNWHYYTLTRENNDVRAYRDGSYINEADFISNIGQDFKKIGYSICEGCGEAMYFEGELDNIMIFKIVLSEDQIEHNLFHNSNYLLNIEDGTGKINGWIWSNGIGWICFGDTCSGLAPDNSTPDAKLYWFSQGGETYPHMIGGWANAVAFNDTGWMSLQSGDVIIANYDEYNSCVSCSFRDEENGLVMYLKMDEDDGLTASDSSGFGNNGSLKQFEDPIWMNDGKISNCLSFDGINDYVEIDVITNPELKIAYNNFSVEVWIKNEKLEHSSPAHLSIISGKVDEEWELYFNSESNELIFNIFEVSVKGSVTNINDWTHVIVTVNRNGSLEMYINDVRIGGDSISDFSGESIDNDQFFIGTDSLGSFWDDKIDIVRIYTRILNRDEITHNYEFPEKKFCSACLEEVLDTVVTTNTCYGCERCELQDGITNCELCSSCREYGLVFDADTANIKGFAWGGNSIDDELIGLGWFKFSPSAGAGLYRSYVSSKYGNIYSKANIGSDYTVVPPEGYFNATYMIQANGHIMNWVSTLYESDEAWHMSSDSGNPLNYEYPKLENDYGNILGNLDYNGLINGIYGEVVLAVPDAGGISYDVCLDNKIYFIEGADVIIEERLEGIAYNFQNCLNGGAGTIIIDGNLTIKGDIQYEAGTFSGSSSQLASVAWIIKGDLKIAPEVTELAGTFIVLGEDGVECGYDLEDPQERCGAIFTCDGEESECGNRLRVSGQFLAKNFRFQRTFRSLDQYREAAEDIIYDGRTDEEYCCPECSEFLFKTEDVAIEFLKRGLD